MNFLSHGHRLAVFVLLLSLLVLPGQADAETIYLQLTSKANAATGTVDGEAFVGGSWFFEYQVETTTADSNENNTDVGTFRGAITGGTLVLNGITYTLANGSDTGLVYMVHSSGASYDRINISPTSGGGMSFNTDFGTSFPALFSDVNNLGSANLGAKVFDTTANYGNTSSNSSGVHYPYRDGTNRRRRATGIYNTAGVKLSLFEVSGAASGNFSVGVSATSQQTAYVAEYVEAVTAGAIDVITDIELPGGNGLISKLAGGGGVATNLATAIDDFDSGEIDSDDYLAELQLALHMLGAFDNHLAAKIRKGVIPSAEATTILAASASLRATINNLIATAGD